MEIDYLEKRMNAEYAEISPFVLAITLIKKFKGSFRSFAVIFERKVTER